MLATPAIVSSHLVRSSRSKDPDAADAEDPDAAHYIVGVTGAVQNTWHSSGHFVKAYTKYYPIVAYLKALEHSAASSYVDRVDAALMPPPCTISSRENCE